MKACVVFFVYAVVVSADPDAKAEPDPSLHHVVTQQVIDHSQPFIHTAKIEEGVDAVIPLTRSQLLLPEETSHVFKQEIIETPTLLRDIPVTLEQVPLISKQQVVTREHVETPLIKSIIEVEGVPLIRKEPTVVTTQEIVETPQLSSIVSRKEVPVVTSKLELPLVQTQSIIETPLYQTGFIGLDSLYKGIPSTQVFRDGIFENQVLYKTLPLEIPEIPTVRKELPVVSSKVEFIDTPLVKAELPIFQKEISVLPTQRVFETPSVSLLKTETLVPEIKEIPVFEHKLLKTEPVKLVETILPRQEIFTHKVTEIPQSSVLKTTLVNFPEASLLSKTIPVQHQFVDSLYKIDPAATHRIIDGSFLKTLPLDVPLVRKENLISGLGVSNRFLRTDFLTDHDVIGNSQFVLDNLGQLHLMRKDLPLVSGQYVINNGGIQVPLVRSESSIVKQSVLGDTQKIERVESVI